MPTNQDVFDAAFSDDLDKLRTLMEGAGAIGADVRYQYHWIAEGVTRWIGCSIWYSKKAVGRATEILGTIGGVGEAVKAGVTAYKLVEGGLLAAAGAATPPVLFGTLFYFAGSKLLDIGDGQLVRPSFNKNGWTPLHFAAASNSSITALYLISQGARSDLTDESGRTFFKIAEIMGHNKFCLLCRMCIADRQGNAAELNRLRLQNGQLGVQLNAALRYIRGRGPAPAAVGAEDVAAADAPAPAHP